MRYQKPEVVQLGQAVKLILGGKSNPAFEEASPFTRRGGLDCELDD